MSACLISVQALVMAQSVHLSDLGSGNTPVFVSPAFSAVKPAHIADVGATPMEDDTGARKNTLPDAMLTSMSGRSTGNPMANTGRPRATTLARIAAANAACLSEVDLVRFTASSCCSMQIVDHSHVQKMLLQSAVPETVRDIYPC